MAALRSYAALFNGFVNLGRYMNNGFAVLLDMEPQQKQCHWRFSNKQLLEWRIKSLVHPLKLQVQECLFRSVTEHRMGKAKFPRIPPTTLICYFLTIFRLCTTPALPKQSWKRAAFPFASSWRKRLTWNTCTKCKSSDLVSSSPRCEQFGLPSFLF